MQFEPNLDGRVRCASLSATRPLPAQSDGERQAAPGRSIASHAGVGVEARAESNDCFGRVRCARKRRVDPGRSGARQFCHRHANGQCGVDELVTGARRLGFDGRGDAVARRNQLQQFAAFGKAVSRRGIPGIVPRGSGEQEPQDTDATRARRAATNRCGVICWNARPRAVWRANRTIF